jgi:hypothetical protein
MEKPKIRNMTSKPRKVKNQGVRNRNAGHNYERQLAIEFRNLGDTRCRTSRQASRLLDDCKVDLSCYFLNVQAKYVKANIDYPTLINEIYEKLAEDMPERADLPIAVFHKKNRSEIVVMTKEDFYKILPAYKKEIDGD